MGPAVGCLFGVFPFQGCIPFLAWPCFSSLVLILKHGPCFLYRSSPPAQAAWAKFLDKFAAHYRAFRAAAVAVSNADVLLTLARVSEIRTNKHGPPALGDGFGSVLHFPGWGGPWWREPRGGWGHILLSKADALLEDGMAW